MDNHLNISLNKTILAIVETALSNFTPDKVLLIPVHYLLAHPTITNLESTVYFVFYRPDNFTFVGMFESDKSIENLNSKLKFRKMPKLFFKVDKSEEFASEIEKELVKIHKDES